MHDSMVSRAVVVAFLLWLKVGAMVSLTWVLAVADAPLRYEGAVGLTAVLSMCVASVWQIRVYAMRVSSLIRVTRGIEGPDAELHSIGGPRSRMLTGQHSTPSQRP